MTRGTLLFIFMIGSLHRSAPQSTSLRIILILLLRITLLVFFLLFTDCSYPLSQYRDQFNSVSTSGNLEAFQKESVVILRDQPFNCSGTITGVTIRVNEYDSDFNRTLRFAIGEKQGIYVYFILISGEEKNNAQSVRGFAVNNDMVAPVEAGSSWYTTLKRPFSPVKVEGGDIVGMYIPQNGFDGVTFIQPLSRLNSGTAVMINSEYVNVTSSNDISDVIENVLVNKDITSGTLEVQAPLIQFTFGRSFSSTFHIYKRDVTSMPSLSISCYCSSY